MNSKIKRIKSEYVLKIIFSYIPKDILFNLVKTNKELQKILHLIEIHIVPEGNKMGKFINISENISKNFHIYFNEEIIDKKTNILKKNHNVRFIKIIIDDENENMNSFESLFDLCNCVKCIIFKKFYRSNIREMNKMFKYCSSLKTLNLCDFNTNNVTNLSGMFLGCSKLEEINLTNFNTNNVTDMSYMFSGCTSLKKINLSNFNTNNVINMDSMFSGCASLKELDLSHFNCNKVINMGGMFWGCLSLEELILFNINISNVAFMELMFAGCSDELKKKVKAQNKNIIIE